MAGAQCAAAAAAAAARAGGSALSAIRADELLAAAGRLRKVQPGGGVQEPAGSGGDAGSAAAGGSAAGAAPAADPRAALLDQIKRGVKLRPMEARKQPPGPAAAAAAGPLGHATPSMAELLRKAVEARRMDAGEDSDSDSDDVLALLDAGSGKEAAQPRCPSPALLQERQKRPRLCHTHVVSAASPEDQLAECSSALPTPALPEQATSAASPPGAAADAGGGAALASDTLPWQASYLMEYVQRCLEALTAMYPQCAPIQARTRASQMAVALFRRVYLRRSKDERAALLRELLMAQSLLAAALWIAVKFEANRSATPDSHIMSRITGVPAGLVRDQERAILADLSWDLMPAALEARAVGLPDDDCGADQQRQLAELALQPQCDGPAPMATTPAPEPAPNSTPAWKHQAAHQAPLPPQPAHPQAGRLAELLASQAQVSMPRAAQRALQALLPTNLLPGGADGHSQLRSQMEASSLECLPSPTLLNRLMAGGL
ncbi:hypothetical protein C2E21_6726 [Chlorella sorokiniana]|uniref:WH2 domain-containing protein n=1 Tax=Chlorella sorokiniana TaxID=3076 RepID=A0A2P6TJY2_CHLSO|nr:hypothetical protein C2E21_6726 [Chlorella sorokiniana]|eukprot:PRW44375.1 hypothetical protein C2E21_6726 [Chlorella sorokiniana]